MKFSIILLALTIDDQTYNMNVSCISSFLESALEAAVDCEVVLVESNSSANYDYNFENFQIIFPNEVFNFHKFLNLGVAHATGDYYVLSNNDVVYDVNFVKSINNIIHKYYNIHSFSPYDYTSNKLRKTIIEQNEIVEGYEIQKHLTGWCIVMFNKVFEKIGGLDVKFNFYYADNDYAMSLIKYDIKHALITNSYATHLEKVKSSKSKQYDIEYLPANTPKYLIEQNYHWVLNNSKMIEGCIKFHEKWGSRKILKTKVMLATKLSKIGLGRLNRYFM